MTNLEPGEEDVKIVMQMAEEAVRAQERDPYTAFANRVRELNYGNSYFFRVSFSCFFKSLYLYLVYHTDNSNFCLQPIRLTDLQKVDPFKACDFFNNCFKDPSTFTVVIVGNIDPALASPLILQYLVGTIPLR